jgi:hypothetical protein
MRIMIYEKIASTMSDSVTRKIIRKVKPQSRNAAFTLLGEYVTGGKAGSEIWLSKSRM